MRIIITVLSLVAIGLASLYDNNYLVTPNEIVWADSVRLRWDDFGGLELPGTIHNLQIKLTESQKIGFLATTCTDIVCVKDGKNYRIKSVFYRGTSMHKTFIDGSGPKDFSLRHELYHFHITEIQSRFLKYNLAHLDEPSQYLLIDSLLQKHRDKVDSISNVYDKLTAHGNNEVYQKSFEKVLDSLLIETDSLKYY
jgi:hypothetical protein